MNKKNGNHSPEESWQHIDRDTVVSGLSFSHEEEWQRLETKLNRLQAEKIKEELPNPPLSSKNWLQRLLSWIIPI